MNTKTKKKNSFTRLLIPILYSAAIFMIVFNQWNLQNTTQHAGDSLIYKNLMEAPAFIARGFDLNKTSPDEIKKWVQLKKPPYRVNSSGLEGLPKRKFLSPFGTPEEEFTMAFIVDMNSTAINFLKHNPAIDPGIYLGYIGENWEVYFNGTIVKSEMHLDEQGRITSRRNWRSVYFPIDSHLFKLGENILAIRIIGDPALGVTGFYYTAPYYIDSFNTIDGRHHYFVLTVLCGVFGFIGIYYLILFLSSRKKESVFNLYYSIFSILLFIYALTRIGYINHLIPDSDIQIRLEFIALFLMVPVLGMFFEEIVRQKITKITWTVFIIYSVFSITQVFFCTQFGAEVLQIWSVTVLIYFSYLFFYDIAYFYIKNMREEKKQKSLEEGISKTFIMNIFVGSILVYACGIFDVLDTLIFHKSFGLFLYSTFVFHIGISITLSINLQRMNRAIGIFGRFTNKEVALLAMHEQIKPGGSSKHATIFFSDIRGFTEKSEAFTIKYGEEGSNKIVFWLNDYLSRMVECVEKTGGTIDKFVGDAVMAHWGASASTGNPKQDAYNCVVSALMMRAALLKMNREKKAEDPEYPEIYIGCGINTGVITAGQIGSEKRMEYTVIGDPVNLASRIENLNKILGTDILISENTWRLVKEHVIVEEMPPVRVKGKEKNVRLFALVNTKTAPNGPKSLSDVRKLLRIKPPLEMKNELFAR